MARPALGPHDDLTVPIAGPISYASILHLFLAMFLNYERCRECQVVARTVRCCLLASQANTALLARAIGASRGRTWMNTAGALLSG